MGGLVTFGAIVGAAEHLFASIDHAFQGHGWVAIIFAICGACFFVRHYGVVTLSDLARIAAAFGSAFKYLSCCLRDWSRSLSTALDEENLSIPAASDPQIPALKALQRKQFSTKVLVNGSLLSLVFIVGAIIYVVVDTKPRVVHASDRISVPTIVKFVDRYGALYDAQFGTGGPIDYWPASGVRFLYDPWNFPKK